MSRGLPYRIRNKSLRDGVRTYEEEMDRLEKDNKWLRESLQFILKWNTEDKASQLIAKKALDKTE